MKSKIKLSDAQFVALLWIVRKGGGGVVRWNGGFWTIPGMTKEDRPLSGDAVPRWYTGASTVMVLERLGLVRRADDEYGVQHWRAPRRVTSLGLRVLADAEATTPMPSLIDRIERAGKWRLEEDLKLFAEWPDHKEALRA